MQCSSTAPAREAVHRLVNELSDERAERNHSDRCEQPEKFWRKRHDFTAQRFARSTSQRAKKLGVL